MRTIRLPSFFFSSLIVVGVVVILTAALGQQRSFAYQQQTPHKSGASTANPGVINNRTTSAAATPGAKGAKETFAVVQVGEDIQVVAASSINALKKQVKDEYKKELKKYHDAKVDKNNKDANTEKPPVEKKVVTLKSGFKTKDDAQNFADDKIQEREKAAQKTTTSKW